MEAEQSIQQVHIPNTQELLQPNNEDQLRQEISTLRSELIEAKKELSTRIEEEANTNAKLLRQRELLTRAGHQIQEINENIKKKNQDITSLKEEVTSLKHQLKSSESEKTAALNQIQITQQELKELNNEIQRLRLEEQRANNLHSEIEKIKIEFASEAASSANAREEVNKAVLSLQRSHRDKQSEYEEKITRLEKSYATLEKEFASYRVRAQSLVQATGMLPSGEGESWPSTVHFSTDTKVPALGTEGVIVSLPDVEEQNAGNDIGVVEPPVRREEVLPVEFEQTRFRTLEGLQEARVLPRAEEGVLQQKVTALEAHIVHLQKELQDRVSQEEIRRIRRLLEKQKKKTETYQNEIKLLSEKYEEEKRKQAEYKQYASTLLHEKQNEISNLKDTIEVMEHNTSGTKTPLLSPSTSPLEAQDDSHKLHLEINLLKKELEESKRMSELLFLQQDVLKEEIRRLERTQKRDGNFNSEYLKNVLLKYMQTGRHEGLVPVIAEMLQFSPEELASVTKGHAVGTVKVGGLWQGLFQ